MIDVLVYWYGGHRELHSVPTRRSSDLPEDAGAAERSEEDAGLEGEERRRGRDSEPGSARGAGGGRAARRAHPAGPRSEEHTSELQSRLHLVCRLLLEKKNETVTVTIAG